MPTCHVCEDTKKCRACTGGGDVACSCQSGRCQFCHGSGSIGVGENRIVCMSCKGSGICPHCSGAERKQCDACKGSGHCSTCFNFRLKWKEASDLAKAGDAYNAVVVLQELLKRFEEKKQSNATNSRLGGAGAGALIGYAILPGVGGYLGGLLGNLAGKAIDKNFIESLDVFEAETNYRLGVIYEMMHHPASLSHYMNAKLLDPSHDKAGEALTRLQPKTPVSPQLEALDDDI